jgi:hypothetical protein
MIALLILNILDVTFAYAIPERINIIMDSTSSVPLIRIKKKKKIIKTRRSRFNIIKPIII